DARRLESRGGDAREAALGEQRADAPAELDLSLAGALEAEVPGLAHDLTKAAQAVGRHRRVVGVRALLVGLHDVEPLAKVQREARALRLLYALARRVAEHHEPRARGAGPALLR